MRLRYVNAFRASIVPTEIPLALALTPGLVTIDDPFELAEDPLLL